MDSFDLKVEKANAILRYRRLQKITALFRFMEVCIFFFIISRFTTQLPFSFKISGDYFRGLSITVFSPGFIFILGNAIVLILFLKSGKTSAQESQNHDIVSDFSDGYVENCETRMKINHTEEIKKQGKQTKQSKCENRGALPHLVKSEHRKMLRSRSEEFKRYQHEDTRRELRRSATERCRKSVNYGNGEGVVNSYAEDEMSGDEFRRTVEAFIARQQRSLREEELYAIVTFGA